MKETTAWAVICGSLFLSFAIAISVVKYQAELTKRTALENGYVEVVTPKVYTSTESTRQWKKVEE